MYNLIKIPDPILYTNSHPVMNFHEMSNIKDEMIETAEGNNLVGLAANQIGIASRFFIVDLSLGEGKDRNWKMFVNHTLLKNKNKGTVWNWEGCGSINRLVYNVERAKFITVTAYDENGKEFGLDASGDLAYAIQHEADHVNGITLNKKKNRGMKVVYN